MCTFRPEICLYLSIATSHLNQQHCTSYKSDPVHVGYVTKVICDLRKENAAVCMQGILYLADTYNQLFILQFVAIHLLGHAPPL